MAALLDGRHQHDASSDHARADGKVCIVCEHKKPRSEFFPSRFFSDGFTDTCRPCVIERAQAQRTEREAKKAEAEKKARAAAKRKARKARAKGPAPQSPPPPPKRPSKRKPKTPKPTSPANGRTRAPRKKAAAPEPEPGSKTCTCCGETKPITAFHRQRDRRAARCSECSNRLKREARARDPEHYRAQRREAYWRNVTAERARALAYIQTQRGRENNLVAVSNYQARNPEKVQAWRAVKRAIQSGQLKPSAMCQALGCDRPAAQKHHLSYRPDRHTDVVELCRKHHEDVHHFAPVRLKPTASHAFATSPRDHIPSSNPNEQEGPAP